jgi:hypothetical protein
MDVPAMVTMLVRAGCYGHQHRDKGRRDGKKKQHRLDEIRQSVHAENSCNARAGTALSKVGPPGLEPGTKGL